MIVKLINKCKRYWFWIFILIIWFFQVYYTIHSTNKIRLEELAESVRNVFWLQNRTIYDGISSNVGWYGTLLIIYNIFGFFLFEAKFFRLVVHLVSLICLGKLLKRLGEERRALLPLVTIGLSPTLLYFNTLQTSFGIDLQYFPICLYLLLSLDLSKPLVNAWKQIFLWLFIMVACMSYPTFIAYLPILLIIYLVRLARVKKITFSLLSQNIFVSLLGFFIPVFFLFFYLREPQMLIYDPHVKSGLFRGGGGSQLPQSFGVLVNNISDGGKQIISDLFSFPGSYYFEANIVRSEFSHKLLFWIVLLIIFLSFWIFLRVKESRLPIILSWLLLITSLVVGNFSGALPGIRRSTGVLFAFWGIYSYLCLYNQSKYFFNKPIVTLLIFCCLVIIPLHHLKVYPDNLNALSLPSPHAADACFNKIPGNPSKSLEKYLNQVKNGEKINNSAEDDVVNVCRLHAVYAATAGSCVWNHLNCPPIWGRDENTNSYIKLFTGLWETYYFNH